MGQREVSEDEISRIARALGYTNEELQKQIYDLDKAGALDEFIQRNDARYRAVSGVKSGYPDLPVSKAGAKAERQDVVLSVYGQPAEGGMVAVDRQTSLGTVSCLASMVNGLSAYAVSLCTRRLGNLLPTRSVLVVDPTKMVGLGDLALMYVNETDARIISIREDIDGKLFGVLWNPEEKIEISEDQIAALHRVVQIILP